MEPTELEHVVKAVFGGSRPTMLGFKLMKAVEIRLRGAAIAVNAVVVVYA